MGVQGLVVADGRVLVVEKRYPEGGAFVLPGGGQNPGETLEDAVRRECLEETGLRVEVGELPHAREFVVARHRPDDPERGLHAVNVIFACRVAEGAAPGAGTNPDPGQVRARWMGFAQLEAANFYPRALVPVIVGRAQAPVYLGDANRCAA